MEKKSYYNAGPLESDNESTQNNNAEFNQAEGNDENQVSKENLITIEGQSKYS